MRKRFRLGVLSKFLVAFIPLMLVVAFGTVYFLADQHIKEEAKHLDRRIHAQLSEISKDITVETVFYRPAIVQHALAALMSDSAMECITVKVNNVFVAGISQPKYVGCRKTNPEKVITVSPRNTSNIQFTAGYSMAEVEGLHMEMLERELVISFIAIVSGLLVGIFALSYIVKAPLNKLLSAIRDMERGVFRHAEVTGHDEIGDLCQAFNSMQDSIEYEKNRTELALQNLRNVYDTAPSILFTITNDGVVHSASKHCLKKLGLPRDEFIGMPLQNFLKQDSKETFEKDILVNLQKQCDFATTHKSMNCDDCAIRAASCEFTDIPMKLDRDDCAIKETLFSLVRDRRLSEEGEVFVCTLKDVTELRQKEKDLHDRSITDTLTGLPNRRGFSQRLENLVGLDSEYEWALLYLDLDNFKTINDTYGHNSGDVMLIETAKRIRDILGDHGYVARMGGDEFTIIVENYGSLKKMEKLGNKLIDAVKRSVCLPNGVGHVGASIGIATNHDVKEKADEAIILADQAMYSAKTAGKSQVYIYNESVAASITDRAKLIQNISAGIPKNWYTVYLQPIIDLTTMKPYAFEALLRVHQNMGFSGNIEELIRAAEETGQMEKLGKWIFDEAIEKFRELTKIANMSDFKISINLSPCQLTQDFVDYAIEKAGMYPDIKGRVILEITETAAFTDFDLARKLLQELRDHQYRIAVDDFGTGYSSLSLISQMPIDVLKLDREFASDFHHAMANPQKNDGQTSLVKCIVTLAKDLNIQLIAEGLETDNVVDRFRDLGVTFGQGYVFSRPMPNDQIKEWVQLFAGQDSQKDNQELVLVG